VSFYGIAAFALASGMSSLELAQLASRDTNFQVFPAIMAMLSNELLSRLGHRS
jgi:hypothetical protein